MKVKNCAKCDNSYNINNLLTCKYCNYKYCKNCFGVNWNNHFIASCIDCYDTVSDPSTDESESDSSSD